MKDKGKEEFIPPCLQDTVGDPVHPWALIRRELVDQLLQERECGEVCEEGGGGGCLLKILYVFLYLIRFVFVKW